MKNIKLYNLLLLLILSLTVVQAQKVDTKFKKTITCSPTVNIEIDTRYTDIEIKKWNQNKVVVEGLIQVDKSVEDQATQNALKNGWNYEVEGDENNIRVKSEVSSTLLANLSSSEINGDLFNLNFLSENCDLQSYFQESRDVPFVICTDIDSLLSNSYVDYILPPLPPSPPAPPSAPLPPLPPSPPLPPNPPQVLTPFDFNAYKKDKNYLEKWKAKNKDALDENATLLIDDEKVFIQRRSTNGGNQIIIQASGKDSLGYFYSLQEEMRKEQERVKEEMKKSQEYLKRDRKELEKARKEYEANRKLWEKENQIALKDLEEKRKEIRIYMDSRLKNKSKKTLKLTVPKSAVLNLNVRYGTLKFGEE